jgi:hypothetical protein
MAEIRALLTSLRATLVTAVSDTPADLQNPQRNAVLERRIAEIDKTLAGDPDEIAAAIGELSDAFSAYVAKAEALTELMKLLAPNQVEAISARVLATMDDFAPKLREFMDLLDV